MDGGEDDRQLPDGTQVRFFSGRCACLLPPILRSFDRVALERSIVQWQTDVIGKIMRLNLLEVFLYMIPRSVVRTRVRFICLWAVASGCSI